MCSDTVVDIPFSSLHILHFNITSFVAFIDLFFTYAYASSHSDVKLNGMSKQPRA
jgi:hypothetical protein